MLQFNPWYHKILHSWLIHEQSFPQRGKERVLRPPGVQIQLFRWWYECFQSRFLQADCHLPNTSRGVSIYNKCFSCLLTMYASALEFEWKLLQVALHVILNFDWMIYTRSSFTVILNPLSDICQSIHVFFSAHSIIIIIGALVAWVLLSLLNVSPSSVEMSTLQIYSASYYQNSHVVITCTELPHYRMLLIVYWVLLHRLDLWHELKFVNSATQLTEGFWYVYAMVHLRAFCMKNNGF